MNQFIKLFESKLKAFWETGLEEKQITISEILQYANSNPGNFEKELKEVMFNKELMPLPVVLESLSKDTDHWGHFYVDILGSIFDQAKQTKNPEEILSTLMEFAYIEQDKNPFVQQIADRLYSETNSEHLSSKLAAIATLPAYLKNPTIRNKSEIKHSLQQNLHHKNWKVRYITSRSLGFENMLPEGYQLSLLDKVRKIILGAPPTI